MLMFSFFCSFFFLLKFRFTKNASNSKLQRNTTTSASGWSPIAYPDWGHYWTDYRRCPQFILAGTVLSMKWLYSIVYPVSDNKSVLRNLSCNFLYVWYKLELLAPCGTNPIAVHLYIHLLSESTGICLWYYLYLSCKII